ncbi:MAG: HlyD family efflux transporter periplasmic adaptor subunit [Bacteroidota bacterium]
MERQKPDIELRQDEIREILGIIPPRAARWGTIIIGSVLLALFIGAAWFNYPDRIQSKLTLTTVNPPVMLKAKLDGRILMLNVKDADSVEKGELLGILESSADYSDMYTLDSLILYFNSDSGRIELFNNEYNTTPELNLGEWQGTYSAFRKSLQELIDFNQQGSYPARIASLKKQLNDYKLLYDRQYRQRLVRSEELALKEAQFKRVQQLSDSGTLATTALEAAKSDLLKAQIDVEGARTLLSQTRIEMDRLEYSVITVENEFMEIRDQKFNNLNQALSAVSGTLACWKLNYAFISPVNGTISFTRIWTKDQQVKIGDRVLTVLPDEPGALVGKLLLPLKGSGKVKVGQIALIRLDKYPYMEFGVLKGRVENMSSIPDQDYYSVEISFPDGLITTYSKELEFTQEMTGQAEILTDEMSFLVRIINPIRSLLKRNAA